MIQRRATENQRLKSIRESPRLIMPSDRSEDNHTIKGHGRELKAIDVGAAPRTGAEMAIMILGFESLLAAQVPCDSEGADGEILETK